MKIQLSYILYGQLFFTHILYGMHEIEGIGFLDMPPAYAQYFPPFIIIHRIESLEETVNMIPAEAQKKVLKKEKKRISLRHHNNEKRQVNPVDILTEDLIKKFSSGEFSESVILNNLSDTNDNLVVSRAQKFITMLDHLKKIDKAKKKRLIQYLLYRIETKKKYSSRKSLNPLIEGPIGKMTASDLAHSFFNDKLTQPEIVSVLKLSATKLQEFLDSLDQLILSYPQKVFEYDKIKKTLYLILKKRESQTIKNHRPLFFTDAN